jgi:hypothetical protein
MKHFFFPRLNLQLFAEGGAPAGDGGAEGTGVSAPAAGVQNKGAKGNPLANVVYGKQKESAPAAGVQNTEPAKSTEEPTKAPDRKAEFEAMIKGDYKEAYQQNVQNIVQHRLKGAKENEDRLTAMNPLMDLLAARYGVKADDIQGLTKALESDDAWLEQAAADKNMDAQQYRQMLKLQSENARLKNNADAQFRQQQMNQQYEKWEQQAEEARKRYPNLDLNVESQNPQFRQMLMAGVDVGSAYLVLHQDDILTGVMQQATSTAKQQVANSIAAGKNRPAENGTSGQSGVVIKSDPSKWTRADREEVRRRAARGERIEL